MKRRNKERISPAELERRKKLYQDAQIGMTAVTSHGKKGTITEKFISSGGMLILWIQEKCSGNPIPYSIDLVEKIEVGAFRIGDRVSVPFLGESRREGTVFGWDEDLQSWQIDIGDDQLYYYDERDLCASHTANYSEESAASAAPSSNGSAVTSEPLDIATLTSGQLRSTSPTSPISPSTGISDISAQKGGNMTSLPSPSLAQEHQMQENGRDLPTQTLPSGGKGCESSTKSSPSMQFGNSPWEFSEEELESCLGESELVAIDLNLEKFRLPNLEQDTVDGGYLSFPTLTSNVGLSSRSSGQNNLERWFRDNDLTPSGSKLSAQAMSLIMGFPANWCDAVSPLNLEFLPEQQEDSKPEFSLGEQSRLPKRQSPLEESSILKVSGQGVPQNNNIAGHHFWVDHLELVVQGLEVENVLGDFCLAKVRPWWGSGEVFSVCLEDLELIEEFSCEVRLLTIPSRDEGKAISLHQPWATLIAQGKKQYETRSWSTKYRGKFLVCAAQLQPSKVSLHKFGLSEEDCSLGAAIAICDLVDCVPITQELIDQQSEQEIAAGEWAVGRYAWKLENVTPLNPVPIRGRQGLWNVNLSDFENAIILKAAQPSRRRRGRAQSKASGSLSRLRKRVNNKEYYFFQYNYDVRDFSAKRGWRTVKVSVPKLKSHLIADVIRENRGIREVLSLLGKVPVGEIRE